MDLIKWILVIIGLLAVIIIGYWIVGIIYGLFWLGLYAGVIGLVGYGGYKLFFDRDKSGKQLEDKTPISIAEMGDADRALEEYRQKYLPK